MAKVGEVLKAKLSKYLKSRDEPLKKQAELCGISYSTFKRYGRGEVFPDKEMQGKINAGLGIVLMEELEKIEVDSSDGMKLPVEAVEKEKKQEEENTKEKYAKILLQKH
ncbi:MAG: hypothetical protein GXO65_01840, partial [Euryarchaeota archaeon]|nr:hypothetical protein [Euryarchaeota archaeon]